MDMVYKGLAAFFISMLPVFELRGGIIFAAAKGIPFATAFIICFMGNIIPVPFILLFIRKIFAFLKKFRYSGRIVELIENKVRAKEKSIRTYQLLGLFLFVAVPLPGTGAWTGALIAVMCDIQLKKAFPAIALGVFCAGMIMSVISYLIPGFFFSLAL